MIKPHLVILPGYDGDGDTFKRLDSTLSKLYSCHYLDFPFIKSSKKAYSLDELTNFVNSQTKTIDKFHLVGFSMGGVVATRFAELFPEKLLSLTLISSSVYLAKKWHLSMLLNAGRLITSSVQLSRLFTYIYCSKFLKNLLKFTPSPIPQVDIKPSMGFAYFGTLVKVISETNSNEYRNSLKNITAIKRALLCRDDASFPAQIYQPILEDHDFKLTMLNEGGHATGKTYWENVATFMIGEIN